MYIVFFFFVLTIPKKILISERFDEIKICKLFSSPPPSIPFFNPQFLGLLITLTPAPTSSSQSFDQHFLSISSRGWIRLLGLGQGIKLRPHSG